jgi:predicted MFS family arabinose efflux permease
MAAVIGAGEGLFLPASMAIMPSLVGDAQLQAANAISMAGMQVGALAGPALAGALVAVWGSAPAFAVDAATFGVSALTLAMIGRGPARTTNGAQAADHGPTEAAPAAQPEGGVWQLLRRERLLKLVLIVVTTTNLAFGGAFEVALPDLAHQHYGAAGFGALLAALSLGTLAGTLVAARATSLRRPAVVASYPVLAGAAVIALTPFLGGLVGASAAVLLFGACNGFANIVFITALQKWTPARLLGRVMSLITLASLGTFPISVAATGLLVGHLGPAPFFPVAGALLGLAVLGALTQSTFRQFGAAAPAQLVTAADVD